MIRTNTTFVIGAGASAEVNLPVGSELKQKISDIMARKSDRSSNTQIALDNWPDDYQNTRAVIQRALPLASSIDNYLHTHKGDKGIQHFGKIGIVSSILHAERESELYYDKSVWNAELNFANIASTWYVALWHMLSTDVDAQDIISIKDMFKNVKFVVFNYDRCLEFFLFEALRTYLKLSDHDACDVLEGIEIYHPYGTVGRLSLTGTNNSYSFGAQPTADNLKTLSEGIQTFTESLHDSAEIRAMQDAARKAERLVFLGYAFHPINMKLLFPIEPQDNQKRPPEVFATTRGISLWDQGKIAKNLGDGLRGITDSELNGRQPFIVVKDSMHPILMHLEDCACSELFRRHSFALRD